MSAFSVRYRPLVVNCDLLAHDAALTTHSRVQSSVLLDVFWQFVEPMKRTIADEAGLISFAGRSIGNEMA
jgi:hypothetical protein